MPTPTYHRLLTVVILFIVCVEAALVLEWPDRPSLTLTLVVSILLGAWLAHLGEIQDSGGSTHSHKEDHR